MDQFKEQREQMVKDQIVGRGVQDSKVLAAMRKIPREKFIAEETLPFAYGDSPLPIEEGQTISQPFIVALMTELAQINPQDKVLEIGTGSGYSTAILAELSFYVYSVERHAKLAELAKQRLKGLGYANVTILVGDGTVGWKDFAPYNAIIVTASGQQIPPCLMEQLSDGGRLIIPIGPDLEKQSLIRVTKVSQDHYCYEDWGAVRFVPLIGKCGWRETNES